MRIERKQGMELLTPETQAALRAIWKRRSADLWEREAVPGNFARTHPVKGNQPLIDALNRVFEGYMQVFAQQETTVNASGGDIRSEPVREATFASVAFTQRMHRELIGLLGDELLAMSLLGSAIHRCNETFCEVFPQWPQRRFPRVPNSTLSAPLDIYKPEKYKKPQR